MAYIGNSPDLISTGRRAQYHFTAIAGQTAFSGTDDNGLQLDLLDDVENDVYFNGSRLILDDDYTISGNTLTLTSGAAAGDILVIVTQDDVQNFNSYTKAEADSRYLNIDGDITAGDLQVVGQITATSFGEINLADNVKAKFGTGDDLQIYHSGANSYITDAAVGELLIGGSTSVKIQDSSHTNTAAVFTATGATTLYYNNSPKFITTSTGIDVTGTVTADERLGIGTTTPSDSLHIYKTDTDASLRLQTASQSLRIDQNSIRTQSASPINIFTNDTHANNIYISSTGNVGIGTGTTGPSEKLYVSGDTRLGAGQDYGSSTVLSVAPGTVTFDAPGVAGGRLKIDGSTGNVGIGTNSPTDSLHIYKAEGAVGANHATLKLGGYSTTGVKISAYRADGNSNYQGITFNPHGLSSNFEAMRIDSGGNVGIGMTNPSYKVDVSGPVRSNVGVWCGPTYMGFLGQSSASWTTEWVLLQELSFGPPLYMAGYYYFQSWTHGSMGRFRLSHSYNNSSSYSTANFYETQNYGGVQLHIQIVSYNGVDYLALQKNGSNGGQVWFNGYLSGLMDDPWNLQVVTSGVTVISTAASS